MKFLALSMAALGVFFSPLSAEIEDDVDVIVSKTCELMDPYMDQLFSYFGDTALSSSDKTMELEELKEKFLVLYKDPEFAKIFYSHYESSYTPEEISRIRQFHEDETFMKWQKNGQQHTQIFMGAINETLMSIIDKFGTLKEITKVETNVMSVTSENFADEVENYSGNLILDVYADWCQPCKKMKPIFDALSVEFPEIKFVKINSDEAKDILQKYKVKGLPSFLFLKDGKEVGRHVGFADADTVKEKMNEFFH